MREKGQHLSPIEEELEIVRMVKDCKLETCGVDAFALVLLKSERQMRRLFTHLVFQFECFKASDSTKVRETLEKKKTVYFGGFERGINALAPQNIESLVGTDFRRLTGRVDEAQKYRKKIFHGQLTSDHLTREELEKLTEDLTAWCRALAAGAGAAYGYDGFGRGSLQKSESHPGLANSFKVQFNAITCYSEFIARHMLGNFRPKGSVA